MVNETNPFYGLSYEEVKAKVRDLIQSGSLPKSWKDFYYGSTGSALAELLVALSLMINYEVSKAREESYITTATLESSILHAAATLGYPVNRERAATIALKVATNPLDGITNEPLDQLIRDYSFEIFPGSYDSEGRPRLGRVESSTFATLGNVPFSLSPIDARGDYNDKLVIVPGVAKGPDGNPLVDRPDLEQMRNWKEVVLNAGVWVRNIVRGQDILSAGGRYVIREPVDNDRIIIRVYDEYSPYEPTIVKTTKYFEETLPIYPQQDRRELPVFELTMPYGVVLFFGKFFGFPLSPNATVVIDYLVPYPYSGSIDPYSLSFSHPGYQVRPTDPDSRERINPQEPDDEEYTSVYRLLSNYSVADSKEKVKYTVWGYRASQRRAVTLNDYKYLLLSWRGDIVDAIALPPSRERNTCCKVVLSYVSVFFNEAGIPFPRLLLPEEKIEASKFISERGIAGVTVEIVDPEYRDHPYQAVVYVDPRNYSKVQEAIANYFNSIVPKFGFYHSVGKITVDLSKIPGVKRIYPTSSDPTNLKENTVILVRPDITYVLES